jgi:hypothetical protein
MKQEGKTLQQTSEGKSRKPYLKPAFQRERVFETMALNCGKSNSISMSCRSVPKNS